MPKPALLAKKAEANFALTQKLLALRLNMTIIGLSDGLFVNKQQQFLDKNLIEQCQALIARVAG
jgi:hypothetical protein